MAKRDLSSLDSHFQFGANWRSFAQLIDTDRIEAATRSLQELVGPDLSGKSFLDIGCGSGLSSLAAARLGAASILATDIDPLSTKTAAELLATHLPPDRFAARTISVFDMNAVDIGCFDVVHSWGVLHHTGAMWQAIERAVEFTKLGGLFVFAIYKKTPFCAMWRVEKALYSRAPRRAQRAIFALYRIAVKTSRFVRRGGSNPDQISRGMDEEHDFHDWLGGYPYESATLGEIDRFLAARGFTLKHAQRLEPSIGLLGSGCAEYVYLRSAAPAARS